MIKYYLLFLFLSLSLDENFGKLKLSVKNLTILCISLLLFWIWYFLEVGRDFYAWVEKLFSILTGWYSYFRKKMSNLGTFLTRKFERK